MKAGWARAGRLRFPHTNRSCCCFQREPLYLLSLASLSQGKSFCLSIDCCSLFSQLPPRSPLGVKKGDESPWAGRHSAGVPARAPVHSAARRDEFHRCSGATLPATYPSPRTLPTLAGNATSIPLGTDTPAPLAPAPGSSPAWDGENLRCWGGKTSPLVLAGDAAAPSPSSRPQQPE